MKRIIYLIAALPVLLFSCKGDNNKLIQGSWHSVKIEDRDMDNFFIASQKYIDTIGKNNDDATNIAVYGVTNMDSLRKELQLQFDSAKAMQAKIATQTVFRFEKDSVAAFSFPGGALGSGKWYLDKDGVLVLDEKNDKGESEESRVKIIKIDEGSMKLEFIKNEAGVTDTSYVTFRKDGK